MRTIKDIILFLVLWSMGSTEFARAPVMKQSQTNGLRIAPILLRKKGEKHKRIGTTFMARKSVA